MHYVDTHAHLYAQEFDADIEEIISKAKQAQVHRFFLPSIDSQYVEAMHALCKKHSECCFPMIGLHPCSVKENYKEELATLYRYLQQHSYCAIGEIGIDLYWDKTFFAQQVEAFKTQINWALEYELPIAIHSRNSFDEVYDVLQSLKTIPKGIFHCFSGNAEQAKKIVETTPLKLGIGGVLTFKNSGLDKAIEQIGLEHLVLETDAPYLAPTPHRGKRNEPAYIPLVAAKLAEIKHCTLEEVARITTGNAEQIFGHKKI
ncbi:MAG: TatD family hydrolase [Bacteroidetes bacterium]|nr:TatD family hydrolase [Bacteroidota bacterium]